MNDLIDQLQTALPFLTVDFVRAVLIIITASTFGGIVGQIVVHKYDWHKKWARIHIITALLALLGGLAEYVVADSHLNPKNYLTKYGAAFALGAVYVRIAVALYLGKQASKVLQDDTQPATPEPIATEDAARVPLPDKPLEQIITPEIKQVVTDPAENPFR